MGKFSKIKKYNLKSLSINEKIKFLDKEMEKTGLNEKMTTQGMYSIVQPNPGTPQETANVPNSSNIGGSGFNQSSAGSGTEGDAPTFSSTSDLYNSSANATIFPSTNYGGKQGFGIVIGPSFGAGTTYGIIEGGNTYRAVLGGHLAGGTRGSNHYYQIYKAKADNPATYGQDAIDSAKEQWQLAVQVEAALIEIGYDNTLFNVTWKAYRSPILFENLSGFPSYSHPTKGLLYLVPFNILGTANKYVTQPEIPPHNVVMREDDLGDPNFLGIDIGRLSSEAFKALLKRLGYDPDSPDTDKPEGDIGDKKDNLLDDMKDAISDFVDDVKDKGKEFFDDLKDQGIDVTDPLGIGNLFDSLTDKLPAAEYSKDIADSIKNNKPKVTPQEDIPKEDIDKYINNIDKKSVKVNTKEEPYADDNIITDENGNVRPRSKWPTDKNGNQILDYSKMTMNKKNRLMHGVKIRKIIQIIQKIL